MDNEQSSKHIIDMLRRPGELPYEYERQNEETMRKIHNLIAEKSAFIREHMNRKADSSEGK